MAVSLFFIFHLNSFIEAIDVLKAHGCLRKVHIHRISQMYMDIKLNVSKIIIAPYVMDVFMTKNISVNRSGRKKLLDSTSFCPW